MGPKIIQIFWPDHVLFKCFTFSFIRRFYPKRLTVHSGYTCFCQYMCSLGLEPTTFALLTQCSTTEPQEVFSWIANVTFLHHTLNKTKHCLVIGQQIQSIQQSIDSCVNIVLLTVFWITCLSISYLKLLRLICSDSSTLSSCHILLPFSKLWRINCDNMRKVEGVWINLGLTIYDIFKVKTMQCYFKFDYLVSVPGHLLTWKNLNIV